MWGLELQDQTKKMSSVLVTITNRKSTVTSLQKIWVKKGHLKLANSQWKILWIMLKVPSTLPWSTIHKEAMRCLRGTSHKVAAMTNQHTSHRTLAQSWWIASNLMPLMPLSTWVWQGCLNRSAAPLLSNEISTNSSFSRTWKHLTSEEMTCIKRARRWIVFTVLKSQSSMSQIKMTAVFREFWLKLSPVSLGKLHNLQVK